MKRITAGLLVGLVTIGAALQPASAADMGGRAPGGIKDYGGGGVPVPAPVPYEEHYKWYVSAGIGYTVNSSGSITHTPEIAPRAFGDERGPVVFSGAFGRYITPSLRMELGMDFRTKERVVRGGNTSTVRHDIGANFNEWRITHGEEADIQTNTYMLNGYYDILRTGRFKPYLGAGIGFATHRLTRQFQETTTCIGTQAGVGAACNGAPFTQPTTPASGGTDATGVGLAASLMAGVGINLSARTHLDIGYRFMWQGGHAVINLPSAFGSSVLDVGSRKDHEIRTSLRFDLW
jgi:opacity protein-like surface antigen